MKAQSAIEFLISYSWAMLAITIITTSLWYMGYFNLPAFTGSHATGFSNLKPVDWVHSGNLTVVLVNNAETEIQTTNATFGGVYTAIVVGAEPGEQFSLELNASPLAFGEYYDKPLIINYLDVETNFYYIDSGKLTGEAS